MLFVVSKLFLTDFSSGTHSRISTDLFERQQIRTCIHHTARYNDCRQIQSSDSHKNRRYRFITACDKHTSVKSCRISMNLNHIGNHISGNQRIIDSVMPLRNPVTDICRIITRTLTAFLCDSLYCLFYKKIQMGTSRMTVSECTLNHNLWLGQIFYRPSHSHLQRIVFRRKCSYFLTVQFHIFSSILLFFCSLSV